jgi:hypothetical protein
MSYPQVSTGGSSSFAHQEELDLARAVAASLQTQVSDVAARNAQLEKDFVAGRGEVLHFQNRMLAELVKFGEQLDRLEQRDGNGKAQHRNT